MHDFIESLPFGYNSILGQDGVNLTANQKFGIAMLMVLLRDPAVILIDSSSTDPDILSHALTVFQGKTIIFTSDTPSSFQPDKILYL